MKKSYDPNVTLHIDEDQKYFPCPVCKKLRVLEQTIKGKPYLTCNDCGVQLFVRGKEGIKRISKQIDDYSVMGISKGKLALLDHYNELQKKLIIIKGNKPILGKNENLEIQENLITQELAEIKRHLSI